MQIIHIVSQRLEIRQKSGTPGKTYGEGVMYCQADFSAKGLAFALPLQEIRNWRKICLFDPGKILPTSAEKGAFALCTVRQDKVNYAVSERQGNRFDNVNKDDKLYLDVLGCNWAATGLY